MTISITRFAIVAAVDATAVQSARIASCRLIKGIKIRLDPDIQNDDSQSLACESVTKERNHKHQEEVDWKAKLFNMGRRNLDEAVLTIYENI